MQNNTVQKFQSRFQFVVTTLYNNQLKPDDYKRNGNDFRLIDGDIGKMINYYRPWINSNEHYCFSLYFGVYFESGERIENTLFKIYDCRFEKKSPDFEITDTLSQEELYHQVEHYYLTEIKPWIIQFKDKDSAIKAIIQGDVSVGFRTIQFMIDNDYGQQMIPFLLDHYQRVDSYIAQVDRQFAVPIYRDKTVYNVYLTVKGEHYTLEEVKALSSYMNIKYHEAAILMKKQKVLLKSGSAMEVRLIIKDLNNYGIQHIIEPPFPYEL